MRHTNLIIIAVFLVIAACGSSNKKASDSDCNGKDYCYIFRSSTTISGDLDADNDGNGIEEADALCEASKPADTGNVKALLVDGTNRVACTSNYCSNGNSEHVDWVINGDTQYRRKDGTTIIKTSNGYGLFTFNLTNNMTGLAGTAYTGLNANYTTGSDCNNWNDSTAGQSGSVGTTNSTTSTAISNGTSNCNNSYYLICVEQ